MLFSATQTRRVEDLARISLKKEPLYVGVDDDKEKATVDGLEQVICWIVFQICLFFKKKGIQISVKHMKLG